MMILKKKTVRSGKKRVRMPTDFEFFKMGFERVLTRTPDSKYPKNLSDHDIYMIGKLMWQHENPECFRYVPFDRDLFLGPDTDVKKKKVGKTWRWYPKRIIRGGVKPKA